MSGNMPGFVRNRWSYGDASVVLAFDDYYQFALLQSNVHEAWVRRNASSMRTDIRYTPTDCFETFPFPQLVGPAAMDATERVPPGLIREAAQFGGPGFGGPRSVVAGMNARTCKTNSPERVPPCP